MAVIKKTFRVRGEGKTNTAREQMREYLAANPDLAVEQIDQSMKFEPDGTVTKTVSVTYNDIDVKADDLEDIDDIEEDDDIVENYLFDRAMQDIVKQIRSEG